MPVHNIVGVDLGSILASAAQCLPVVSYRVILCRIVSYCVIL